MRGELHADGPVVFTPQPSGRETVMLGRIHLGEICPIDSWTGHHASFRLRLPDCGVETWRPAFDFEAARKQIRHRVNDWLNAADLRPNVTADQ